MSGKSPVDRMHPWRAGFQDSLSMRRAEDQRRRADLRRSAERQRRIARLEEQVSHGMITRPSGHVLGGDWPVAG